VALIQTELNKDLAPAKKLDNVVDARVLGLLSSSNLKGAVNSVTIQQLFVEQDVWVRPIGTLVYVMLAYAMNTEQIKQLIATIIHVVKNHHPTPI